MGSEARINEALRRLGDERRLGMVPDTEYRTRRRMLLQSWGERDVTTAPGVPRPRPAAPPPPPPPAESSLAPLWIVIAAVLALAGAGWLVWGL